jgi:hypothetical protein
VILLSYLLFISGFAIWHVTYFLERLSIFGPEPGALCAAFVP